MLEKLPRSVGRALGRARHDVGALTINRGEIDVAPMSIAISSLEFADAGAIPSKYTADGEGVSPPLVWTSVPAEAQSLIFMVEDADSPTPFPFVHAIVWGISPTQAELAAGAIRPGSELLGTGSIGLNSYLQRSWLPPDPPPGHGPHRYVFQLFALGSAPDLGERAGRRSVVDALHGSVIARGLLVGTYER